MYNWVTGTWTMMLNSAVIHQGGASVLYALELTPQTSSNKKKRRLFDAAFFLF
jgi:hypothetical protein